MIAQGNIRVNGGRLRAKVVVFKTTRDLRVFWKRRVRHDPDLGARCLGAVNGLGRLSEQCGGPKDGQRVLQVDRRFFCLIGLTRDNLTMRVLSHESVHAAYCFAKRRSTNGWDKHAAEFDEEAIAYPTGEIARALVAFLERERLLTTAA